MKIKYWTIRVVPSAMNISSIGVGVLAQQPDSPLIRHRFLPDNDAVLKAFGISEEVSAALDDFRAALDTVMTENETLDFGSRFTASGLLSHLADHWNNMVLVDQPKFMVEESADTALDLLFKVLIGQHEQPVRRRRTAELQRLVKKEYARYPDIQQALTLSPTLHTGKLAREVDLAVIQGESVYEVNNSFSFATTDLGNFQNRVEAWTWKVEKLRNEGAVLSKGGEEIAAVHAEADVVAAIWLPKNEKQKELFDVITKEWDELGVIQVPKEHVPQRASQLARKIAG